MIGPRITRFSFGIAILFVLVLSTVTSATAACTTGTGTVTCTGGPGASINATYNNTSPVATQAGTPFPSTLTVTGGSGTVSSVSVTLHSFAAPVNANDEGAQDLGLLLISPTGRNLQLMRSVGDANKGTNNGAITLTIQDGGTPMANPNPGETSFPSGTYEPSAYFDGVTDNTDPDYHSVLSSFNNSDLNDPQTNGSKTFASVFTGDSVNGSWNLYLVADAIATANISFSSWDITITYTAASSPTTTSLSSSSSTAFTTSPGNSMTLTAMVTNGGNPVISGTVLFQEGATNLTCSGGNPVPLNGSGVAQCTASFSTEGLHSLSAGYSGNSTYEVSTGNANVFTYNHATSTGTTYCNAGAISGTASNILPYPSVIYVGDGTSGSPSIGNSVETVSVELTNFSSSNTNELQMLLVSPDGGHALEFWGYAGVGATNGTGNITLKDGVTGQLPTSFPGGTAISPGTYLPSVFLNDDLFTVPPAPSPQPPASFGLAGPISSQTFLSSFTGATADGAWSLFVWNEGATVTTSAAGGWCIDITPATGVATTVSLASNPTQFATQGNPVTFTATVTSTGTVNEGTVAFTENGAPLIGAPNGGIANVSGGVATISTTLLPEGDHTITATYTDNGGSFNDNLTTESMRVDAASTEALNGSTFTYCNPAGITIPGGAVGETDIGPAGPNPSNIFVTNLPGSINTASLTINNFNLQIPGDLESLLVGPNGSSAPTVTQTLDFFSLAAGTTDAAFNQNVTFADGNSLVPAAGSVGTLVDPTSYGATSYFTSPFYHLPATFQYAATQGSSTFASVYQNSIPNGTWSLYFDQITHYDSIPQGATGWCMNFIETPPVLTATEGPSGLQVTQGASSSVTVLVANPSGPGSAGGASPVVVTDTFPSGLTPTGGSGTNWTCGTPSGQTISCTSGEFVASGSNFDTLTLNFSVANNATTTTVMNTAVVSGSALTASVNSNALSITIEPAPFLSVSKTPNGIFTQGQTAEWDITVTNTASGGSTSGITTVVDTLPAGYSLNTASSTGNVWTCGAIGVVVTCTSTSPVTGGGSFNLLKLIVKVPAASPISVTNNAIAYGGGDLTHTNSTTGATTFSTVTVSQVPASIAINGSQTQSAPVSTAFGSLAVTVKDAAGVGIPNYSPVIFTATTGSNGQSGTFSNNTGSVSVSSAPTSGIADPGLFTANTKAGSYSVGVVAGTATTSFSLTNQAVPATITNVTSSVSNGTYGIGAMIPITITFSKAVNVTGTPMLALNSGGIASYSGGTSTATLTFTYTVGAGQSSTALDASSTGALSLNGGAILDSSTTPATLTLPAPGAAGSLSANKAIVISTTAPSVLKTFSGPTIAQSTGVSQLTIAITNPNTGSLTGVAFTDNLPSGMTVASSPGLINGCGGVATAGASATQVILSGGTLAASSSCSVKVNVMDSAASTANNSVQVTSNEAGSSNVSTATITVLAPPSITKSFGVSSIPLGQSTSLFFDIKNPNPITPLTGVGFTDTVPTAGLSSAPTSTPLCGGTLTVNGMTGLVTLSGASLAGNGSCLVTVNVTGTAAGQFSDTTSTVSSTQGGAGAASTASITVVSPPTIGKAFGASNVAVGGTTSLTITIANPPANTVAQSGVAFTDNFPAGLVVASSPNQTNTCGGSLALGTASVALTGGSIPINSSCSVSLNVTLATAGSKTNLTGAVSSANGGTGGTAMATISAATVPTISNAFGAPSVPFGGTTGLTFSIVNPNSGIPLSGIGFTDTLPSGLLLATNATSSCGGTLVASTGGSVVSLTNGSLAAGGSCIISANVTGTSLGTKLNTTSAITSSQSGTGAASNTASVTVGQAPTSSTVTVAPPSQGYDGTVNLTATLSPALVLGQSPATGVTFFIDTTSVGSVSLSTSGSSLTGALPSVTVPVGAGPHTVTAEFTGVNPDFAVTNPTAPLTVTAETVTVTPSASNPMTVQVTKPGSNASLPFTLTAVIDQPANIGNMANAVPVTFTLTPLLAGTSSPSPCVEHSGTVNTSVTPHTLTVSCTFSGLPVNAYQVVISVGGNFYTGSDTTLVAVVDPSLSSVTGAGTLNLSDGSKITFAIAAGYVNNKLQGSLAVLDHKGNNSTTITATSLTSLSIVSRTAELVGIASDNSASNYSFRATAFDNPKGADQFGLVVTAPNGSTVISFPLTTLATGAVNLSH